MPFGVNEAGQGIGEKLVRVVNNAAEKAGMHVLRRPKNLDLGIDNAAQPQSQRGLIRPVHAGIGNHRTEHRGKFIKPTLGHKLAQRSAAAFLLAFDQEDQIERKLIAIGEDDFGRLQVGKAGPLIVAGSPGDEETVALLSGKRIHLPSRARIVHPLHIVMAIDQDRGSVRRERGAASENQGIGLGPHLNLLDPKPHLVELADEEVGRLGEAIARGSISTRTDAGDADKGFQLFDIGPLLLVDEQQCFFQGCTFFSHRVSVLCSSFPPFSLARYRTSRLAVVLLLRLGLFIRFLQRKS